MKNINNNICFICDDKLKTISNKLCSLGYLHKNNILLEQGHHIQNKNESVRKYLERVTEKNMKVLLSQYSDKKVYIALCNIISIGRKIIPIPIDAAEVVNTLKLLSGRRHRRYTALYIISNNQSTRFKLIHTKIKMRNINDFEIQRQSQYGQGLLGGYDCFGHGSQFITMINGSLSSFHVPIQEINNIYYTI